MAKPLILVTGATGTIGTEVVQQLAAAGHRVRALVRDLAKAAKLGATVEVAKGDLAKPETLEAAFAGVEKAFVVVASSPEQATQEGNAFDAAKRAGATHLVKLSGGGPIVMDHMAGTAFAKWHGDAEARLRATGIAWTILRPGPFNANVAKAWGIMARGGLFLPSGNGRDPHIDPRDIGAVAVKVLTEPGHEGKVYDLTGPELLSYAEVVQKVAAATGRPLKFVDVPEATWRQELLGAGVPPPAVDSFAHYFAGVKAGRMYLTSTVTELLGRPARSFDAWVKDHINELLA
jgi:uncharacterized protein YbjT (DUF2867 family)